MRVISSGQFLKMPLTIMFTPLVTEEELGSKNILLVVLADLKQLHSVTPLVLHLVQMEKMLSLMALIVRLLPLLAILILYSKMIQSPTLMIQTEHLLAIT